MIVRAPAKVILFGEHAVVYGQPAIAVPIKTLQAVAEIEPADTPLTITAHDLDDAVITFAGDNPLAEMARITLETLQIAPPQARMTIQSDIPIASGLGSGAAISTVIGRAICQLAGKQLPDAQLNALVYEVEKIHHGTPSGIDNTVIVYEQAVYFIRDEPIQLFENRKSFTLIIADTGKAALTKIAVGDVRKLYETEPEHIQALMGQIGSIAKQAHDTMRAGQIEKLGQLMNENHELLKALTVSSPELDCLVKVARANGALGAKLSGGGRGGNMLALVTEKTSEAVRTALLRAGAVRAFTTTVEGLEP